MLEKYLLFFQLCRQSRYSLRYVGRKRKLLYAGHHHTAAVHRYKVFFRTAAAHRLGHIGSNFAQYGIGNHNANRPQHSVCIYDALDNRIFSGSAKVCPRFQHGSGGRGVCTQGINLGSRQTGFDLLYHKTAQSAALTVDDNDFHTKFLFSALNYPGPA